MNGRPLLHLNNGNRFTTYVIKGDPDSGKICLNGPAARLGLVGDQIIVLSYAAMEVKEAEGFTPKVVFLDEKNRVAS